MHDVYIYPRNSVEVNEVNFLSAINTLQHKPYISKSLRYISSRTSLDFIRLVFLVDNFDIVFQ